MSLTSPPAPSFLTIPAEVRVIIYGYLLVSRRALTLCSKGTLSTTPLHSPETSIMFVSMQILAEAIPVLYQRNSFVIRQQSALQECLAVTANKAVKMDYIRHIIILHENSHLDKTRLAELGRLKSLGKVTVVKNWWEPFQGQIAEILRRYYDLNAEFKYGEEHKRLFELGSVRQHIRDAESSNDWKLEDLQGPLWWVKAWLDQSVCTLEMKDMIKARPDIDCELIMQGMHFIDNIPELRLSEGSSWEMDVSIKFGVSWNLERERYKFVYKAHDTGPNPYQSRDSSHHETFWTA